MVSPISAGGGFTRTGIATVVDMKSNEIEVDVNESYIARVHDGQKVTAILDAYPDWEIPSHVRTIIPTADRQKATVKVRISFDKLDPRILPDMGIKVTFLGDAPKPSDAQRPLKPPRSSHKAPFTMTPARKSSSSSKTTNWSAAPSRSAKIAAPTSKSWPASPWATPLSSAARPICATDRASRSRSSWQNSAVGQTDSSEDLT